MNAEFWDVAAPSSRALPFSPDDVCDHLVADWMPSTPASLGASLVGWPPLLLESITFKRAKYLSLRKQAGQAERQWKGFLSWMLGVAGTRQFLRADGYRWIAPVSAFLQNAVKPVALGDWPAALPKSTLITKRPMRSRSSLMPDYLALRPMSRWASGKPAFAVAESKGSQYSFANRPCPKAWSRQARNIVVIVNKELVEVPRYLVIATRVNPNAAKGATRRIQIRAWNSANDAHVDLGNAGVTELVSGHLFGLLRALRLIENARAVAVGMELRANQSARRRPDLQRIRQVTLDAARTEAGEFGQARTFESDRGSVEVHLAPALIELAQELAAADSVDQAAEAVATADEHLDRAEKAFRAEDHAPAAWTYGGVRTRVRFRFDDRQRE